MASKPWVTACYAAIEDAAAGKDPAESVKHLPELEAERALRCARTIIDRVEYISDLILAEPRKGMRRLALERHTRQNPWARKMVKIRVNRLWNKRGEQA